MHGKHLVLYDGICGLCNRLNLFIIRRDPTGKFLFASMQSETGKRLLAKYDKPSDSLTTFYVLADYQSDAERILSHSTASLFVAEHLSGPWRMATVFRIVPAFLRDLPYSFVARQRYRFYGRYDSCPAPSDGLKARFIDV